MSSNDSPMALQLFSSSPWLISRGSIATRRSARQQQHGGRSRTVAAVMRGCTPFYSWLSTLAKLQAWRRHSPLPSGHTNSDEGFREGWLQATCRSADRSPVPNISGHADQTIGCRTTFRTSRRTPVLPFIPAVCRRSGSTRPTQWSPAPCLTFTVTHLPRPWILSIVPAQVVLEVLPLEGYTMDLERHLHLHLFAATSLAALLHARVVTKRSRLRPMHACGVAILQSWASFVPCDG